MLLEPKCSQRECKWYVGIIQPKGTEIGEKNFCGAFPDGIPNEIAYGDNDHSKVLEGQAKPYVYEKSKNWDEQFQEIPTDDLALYAKINMEGQKKYEDSSK